MKKSRVIKKERNGITKTITISPIIVDSVKENPYKEDRFQAQLRQEVSTHTQYPSKQIKGGLFPAKDFGAEEGAEFTSKSTRMAWIDVPVGTSLAAVQAKIDALGDKAVIYQVLSNDVLDVLSPSEKGAYESGLENCSLEDFQERKALINAETGKIVTDNAGNVIYRGLHFSTEGTEDSSLLPAGEQVEIEEGNDVA